MSNPPKQLGTKLESEVVLWLRDNGWPYAHRRTLRGIRDEGDISLSERVPFTIEGKNSRRSTDRAAIGTWIRELETEVSNRGDDAGAVVHKRRGTTDVGEYIALMPVKYLNYLLERAFGEQVNITLNSCDPPVRKRVIPRYRPPA